MPADNALKHLRAHYAGLEKKRVEHGLIPFPMFSDPLTTEDYLEISSIDNLKNPAQKASRFAAFLVRKLRLEDGTPAFRCEKGRAAETLASGVEGSVIMELIGAVVDREELAGVEELEKKPEPAGPVS